MLRLLLLLAFNLQNGHLHQVVVMQQGCCCCCWLAICRVSRILRLWSCSMGMVKGYQLAPLLQLVVLPALGL